MRSGLFAVMAVGLGACEPATGLQFQIDATGDPTATTVVIYIGKGDGDADSIAAEGRTPSSAHRGVFWPPGLDPESFDLTTTDRTATLSFAPGDDSSPVTVVAVGLTGDVATSVATETILRVPTDLVEVWTLNLVPTVTDVDVDRGRAVQRWGAKPDEHTCVQAVDRSATGEEPKNIFIGIEGDRDCDGWPERLENGDRNPDECADDWHNATLEPSVDKLSCLHEPTLISGQNAVCAMGAPKCNDGEGAINTRCSDTLPFCAPQSLCAQCENSGTPEDAYRCALETHPLDTVAGVTQISHMRCAIDINVNATPPRLCPVYLMIPPALPAATAMGCPGIPRFHSSDPSTEWMSPGAFGGVALDLNLKPTMAGCTISMLATAIAGQAVPVSGTTAHGLVAVDLTNEHGVIVPVVFAFEPGGDCPSTPTVHNCVAIPAPSSVSDTIGACPQSAGN